MNAPLYYADTLRQLRVRPFVGRDVFLGAVRSKQNNGRQAGRKIGQAVADFEPKNWAIHTRNDGLALH